MPRYRVLWPVTVSLLVCVSCLFGPSCERHGTHSDRPEAGAAESAPEGASRDGPPAEPEDSAAPATTRAGIGDGSPLDSAETVEYRHLLRQIFHATRRGRSLRFRDIESYMKALEAYWERGHRAFYLEAMHFLCWRLQGVGTDDPVKQVDLQLRCAELIFEKEPATPLRAELEMVTFVANHSPEVAQMDVEAWTRYYTRYARLFFRLWRRLKDAQDPDYDSRRPPPFGNKVYPPFEASVKLPMRLRGANISPELIEDPRLRRKYEEDLARNRSRREKCSREEMLLSMLEDLSHLQGNLVCPYLEPAPNMDELKALMDEYRVDEEMRARILDRIRTGDIR